MSAKKRKRDVPVLFWVSDAEMEAIQQKMAQFGTKNLSAYLRKMAVDGYVVQLDLPELKELVSLLRRSSNNLNQLTRRVHETGRIYDADLEDIAQRQEQLWEGVKEILTQLRDICPNCGGRNGVLFAAPSSVFSFAHILVFLKCWKDNMGRKQIAAKELRIDENL